MTNSEKLDLLLVEMQDMKSDMQNMNNKIDNLESQMNNKIDNLESQMNNKISNLESQMKQMECSLRNEIKKEFGLILDEVERVHNILDRHKADTSIHCMAAL